MKQKTLGKKLLSLGLAAAMAIASLTGPGAVTNPVEVKAEENNTIEAIYNGNVQMPNGTINVTSGGPITFKNGVTDGYTVNHGLNVYKNAGNYEFTITPTGGATSGSAIKVAYKIAPVTLTSANFSNYIMINGDRIALARAPFELIGDEIRTSFSSDDNSFYDSFNDFLDKNPNPSKCDIYVQATGEGNFKTDGKLLVGQALLCNVKVTDSPKVGGKFGVEVSGAPEGVELMYMFRYNDGTVLQEASPSNEYTVKSEDVGHKIQAVVWAGNGKYLGSYFVTSKNAVAAADSGSSGTGTPTPAPGGSSTSTPSTTPSTSTTTTTTETKPDGTKVETTTQTKADGTKVETVTETKTDGSATTTVKETEKNSSGKEVAVTTVTEKDASGKVQSETTTSVIAKADTNTSATVTAVKDSKGAVTATAAVTKTGTTDETGKTNGAISAAVVKQITEAAGKSDVTITQTVTNGDKKFTVEVNAKNLVSGSNLKIMKLDPKTGEYVLCNKKNYAVNAAGDVNLSVKTDGDFILVNEADAKAASDAILNTVKVKSSSKTVAKGKSTTVAMSSGLNMKNVSTITYTVSNKSVAAVNKNGKVTTKKAGTVTVNAKVTLKNGKTKTVKMTIKVK